jgi:hypothetical protein
MTDKVKITTFAIGPISGFRFYSGSTLVGEMQPSAEVALVLARDALTYATARLGETSPKLGENEEHSKAGNDDGR